MQDQGKKIIHARTQNMLVHDLKHANHFFSRLKGLIGTNALAPQAGLLISPCQQIHTHFMAYPVDVLFLDKNFKVLHIVNNMQPWKITKYIKQAYFVLEIAANSAQFVNEDDALILL